MDIYIKNKMWEEIFENCQKLRKEGKYGESYLELKKGYMVVDKENKHRFDHEMSITGFYTRKEEGYRAFEDMFFSVFMQHNLKQNLYYNLRFYLTRIPMVNSFSIPCHIPDGYLPSSTSIIQEASGYLCVVRAVNYYCYTGDYSYFTTNTSVHTRNFLVKLDDKYTKIDQKELIDNSGVQLYETKIKGIEDIRLFSSNQFLAGYPQVNNKGVTQCIYGEFRDNEVIKIIPLSINGIVTEKNWLPFFYNNRLLFIYKWDILSIYELKDGVIIPYFNKKINIGDVLRGSAPPINYKDGYLCTVHQVEYSHPRKYFHRFVFFDRYFNLKIGRLFYFMMPGIEYNLGIAHSKEGLLVTFSQFDNTSRCAIIDYSIVDKMLENYKIDVSSD